MTQKSRSLVTLLALLVFAGAAGLFAYYGVFKKQEADKQAKEKKEKLFGEVDKARIKGLIVTAKGQTTTLAAKASGGWEIVAPTKADADKSTVDSLVDRLIGLKTKMVVEEKAQDLAKFGLDKPALQVVAKLEDGKELALRSGAENAFDSSVYVATGDSNDVIQAEGGFKWALEKDTFDLRDKRVMPFEDKDVKELEITVEGEAPAPAAKPSKDAKPAAAEASSNHYLVRKTADGKWEMAAPLNDKADETTVNRVLGSLKNLRATKFDTDTVGPTDGPKYGLDKPRLTAKVTLENGSAMTLTAGQAELDKQKKSYARRPEATFVAEIPESIFKDVDVKAADLRDKTVIAVDRNKVTGVKFAMANGETLTLERGKAPDGGAGEDWKITAPAPGEAKKWKMSSLLWVTNSLRGTTLADENATDLAKYGLDKPARAMTLLGEGGAELGTLQIGAEKDNNVYVRSATDRRVFQVEKTRVQDVPSSRADIEEPPKAPEAKK